MLRFDKQAFVGREFMISLKRLQEGLHSVGIRTEMFFRFTHIKFMSLIVTFYV